MTVTVVVRYNNVPVLPHCTGVNWFFLGPDVIASGAGMRVKRGVAGQLPPPTRFIFPPRSLSTSVLRNPPTDIPLSKSYDLDDR